MRKTDRNGIITKAVRFTSGHVIECVVGAYCPAYHGGNANLSHHSGRAYECLGCATYYSATQVRELQDAKRRSR